MRFRHYGFVPLKEALFCLANLIILNGTGGQDKNRLSLELGRSAHLELRKKCLSDWLAVLLGNADDPGALRLSMDSQT